MSVEKPLPLETKLRRAARTVLSYHDEKYVDQVLEKPWMRGIPDSQFNEFREVLTRERAKRQKLTARAQARQEQRPDLG